MAVDVITPASALAQAAEPPPVGEVDPNHWSQRLPAGNGLSVWAGTWKIYAPVLAAIATGAVIRAITGGAA